MLIKEYPEKLINEYPEKPIKEYSEKLTHGNIKKS